jgi:hypothetical protein
MRHEPYIRESARYNGRDVQLDPDTMVLTVRGWINQEAARTLKLPLIEETKSDIRPKELEPA